MLKIILLPFLLFISYQVAAAEKLRIFTWEGYITANDIQEINQELVDKNYNFEAEIIETLAEDAEQMFSVIRNNQCDINFLTLFFIKMQLKKKFLKKCLNNYLIFMKTRSLLKLVQ